MRGSRLPDNLIAIPMTFDALRERASRFLRERIRGGAAPETLLKQPYKLCDFKILYPELFRDIGERHGLGEQDFVGWGDCDLIYGRFADFLDGDDDVEIIGGFHGHLTAVRNSAPFRELFRTVPKLLDLLVDEQNHIVDEIAFRKPLLEYLEKTKSRMFYINKYFCDVVPPCFSELFRPDHSQRTKNFFDAYNPEKDIDRIHYDRDGRLTVIYDSGDSRENLLSLAEASDDAGFRPIRRWL